MKPGPGNTRIQKVPLAALVLQSLVLFFPLLSLKANRIADGIDYLPAPFSHWSFALYLSALVITFTVSTMRMRDRGTPEFMAGVLIFLFPFVHLSFNSHALMPGSSEAARIAPHAGTWICMAGAYILCADGVKLSPRRTLLWCTLLLAFLLLGGLLLSGRLDSLSILKEFENRSARFFLECTAHLFLSGMSVFWACCLGIPLGFIAYKRRVFKTGIFFFTNTVQTVPSLALFGLLIAPLSFLSYLFPLLRELGVKGIGTAPALIALTLYALLPVVLNTYTAFDNISDSVKEAGRGMGMSPFQLFFMVELPNSTPVMLNGIRIAAVLTIGNTAVAALIRAGGLGTFVFQGLGQSAPDLVLLGVIPIIVLAVVTDRIFALFVYITSPFGNDLKSTDTDTGEKPFGMPEQEENKSMVSHG